MITIIQAIILGIIQGITEWLPISSSGHLVIAQHFFKLRPPLIFDIILHVATLFVIFVVFKEEITNMARSVLKLDFKSYYGKLALFIIIGSVPTALIGYFFHDLLESLFYNLVAVGVALILTGTLLFFCERSKKKRELNYFDSLLVGIAQGIAIIPGISRSGATIGLGLLRGIKKETIATFSFLLAIPAIMGASIYEARDLAATNISSLVLFVGMVSAMITGYIFLKILLKIIMSKRFHLFSYYCWLLGLIVIIASLVS